MGSTTRQPQRDPRPGSEIPPFEHGHLCAEHDLLALRLHELRSTVARGDLEAGVEEFARFRACLERHMRVEDEILFPKFALLGPDSTRELIRGLVTEHDRARDLCDSIQDSLASGLPVPVDLDSLAQLLSSHEAKEELFLYPLLFHLADPGSVAELFHRIHPGTPSSPARKE